MAGRGRRLIDFSFRKEGRKEITAVRNTVTSPRGPVSDAGGGSVDDLLIFQSKPVCSGGQHLAESLRISSLFLCRREKPATCIVLTVLSCESFGVVSRTRLVCRCFATVVCCFSFPLVVLVWEKQTRHHVWVHECMTPKFSKNATKRSPVPRLFKR